MTNTPNVPVNRILRSLPITDLNWLLNRAEPFRTAPGEYLYRQGQVCRYLFFLELGTASICRQTAEGNGIEIAIVGPEGLAGIDALLGADASENDIVTHSRVDGLRIGIEDLRTAFTKRPSFRNSVMRYLRVYTGQVEQNVLCSRLHPVEQRLACKLVVLDHFLHGAELPLTQDFLCLMLGASRPRVSTASKLFQTEGLISVNRGRIRLTDKVQLSRYCCECIDVMTQHQIG